MHTAELEGNLANASRISQSLPAFRLLMGEARARIRGSQPSSSELDGALTSGVYTGPPSSIQAKPAAHRLGWHHIASRLGLSLHLA